MKLILITTLLVYMQPVLAQDPIVLNPVFSQSVYPGTEGGSIRICLSLPALTQPQFSSLPCSFDVRVRAVPLPQSDSRNRCDFGTDYTLSSGSNSSTVTFTPGSADSTCFNISLLTDGIVEGDEFFQLIIVSNSITPPACARAFTISQDASAEVHCMDSPDDVVCVSFDIRSALVIEGINRTIDLRSSIVQGRFQREVQIGVVCSPTTADGVIPASRADFTFTAPFSFRFRSGSSSSNPLVIPIVDDTIAEPRESFICTLQSGTTQAVRSKSPEQVTVDIVDNDELIIRWARDFYSFSESLLRHAVQLVTSSSFDIRITVIGRPTQITSGIVTVPLPTTTFFPLLSLRLTQPHSTIVFRGTTYAVATVARRIGDVDQTRNAFIFYPGNTSSLERFTHRDDNVCEYDELYTGTFAFGAVVLASGFKTRKGEPNVTYIAIEDDDRTEINFSRASYTVDEDEGFIEVTVTSTGAFFAPLTVTVTCSPDTASATDFSAGVFTTSFFVNREASSLTSIPIRINITNDNLAESEECFVCEITDVDGPTCAVIGSRAETRICIQDSRACPSGQRLQSHNGTTCEDPNGKGPTVVGCHFDCPAGQLYSTMFKNCYRPDNCPRCKAHASGDPHYTTFDGVYYTIFPQCSHIAAQDCLGGSWSVAHVTSNRCSQGRAPTCIDESILIVPRLRTRLHYRSVNNSYWFVGNVPSSYALAVTLSGTFFTAHLREEDVTVLHQGTRLEVSTSARWAGKMCGLFGTCDCNTTNEFVLRNGTVLAGFNDPRFLPEYNADNETGVCRVRPPPLPQGPSCAAPQLDGEAFCNVLRNTSGPYAACHSRRKGNSFPPGNTYQLPVNSPFEQCVFDYCAIGQSSACDDILAYADRCRGDGIAVGDPPAVCRPTCPRGLEYTSCGPLVPPTCDLPAGVSGCRGGCICPNGSLLSRDGICVIPSSDVEIFFDASSARVTENGTVMACSIRLSSCYPSDIPVSIMLMNASEVCRHMFNHTLHEYCNCTVPSCQRATAGQDFIFPRNITIPANTVEFNFNINILDDDIFELEEVFKLMLVYRGSQSGVRVRSSAATCCITITDNDDLEVCFESNSSSYMVNEGHKVDIILKTNRQFACPFSVIVGTSDGTAVAPGDYMSLMMTVNFDVRTQMAMTMVMSMTDNIVEGDEDLFLTITSEHHNISVCDRGRAVIVIKDRTIVCGFEAPSVMVKEKEGFVTKYISCNSTAPSDFTLRVRTVAGTAQAGSDFVSGTSTVRFRTGSRRASFNVSIINDCSDVLEPLETFQCELSVVSTPSSPGIALATRTSTVTIMDDDVLVSFTNSVVMVMESATFIDVSLSAVGFTAGDGFSVTVNVVGGTAQAGVDFTGTQWTINFPRGSVSMTFRIPINCDNVSPEEDETIDLQLRVPSAFRSCVCLGRMAMMRVDIIDNCPDPRKVNDTVIADPVYTVPLYIRGGNHSFTPGTPLCYEIHGQANRVFNLISDECTSVNAYYQSAHSADAGNVITSIGIVATDGVTCTTVSVNVTSEGECSTVVDSNQALPPGEFTLGVASIRVDPGCVMITVPNCDRQDLMFWVRCRVRTLSFDFGRQSVDQEMIKFVVGRGLGLDEGSHGLIGQFWAIPININPYRGIWRGSFTPLSARWNITMMPTAPAAPRSFAAILGSRTWTHGGRPVIPNSVCLYAGDSQGGPLAEARNFNFGPVVEGHYTQYICEGGIFNTNFAYSKYTGPC